MNITANFKASEGGIEDEDLVLETTKLLNWQKLAPAVSI